MKIDYASFRTHVAIWKATRVHLSCHLIAAKQPRLFVSHAALALAASGCSLTQRVLCGQPLASTSGCLMERDARSCKAKRHQDYREMKHNQCASMTSVCMCVRRKATGS